MNPWFLSALCFCLFGVGTVKAAPADCVEPPAVRQPGDLSLPESARPGERVFLTAALPEGPAGAFPNVRLDWLERPEGRAPDVLPGVPDTEIVFHVPGKYRCRVRAGYIVRTS